MDQLKKVQRKREKSEFVILFVEDFLILKEFKEAR